MITWQRGSDRMAKDITFLSSLGKGVGPDMAILRRDINEMCKEEDVMFRTFSKNEKVENENVARGIKKYKNEFLAGAENIICQDLSLAGSRFSKSSTRLLIASSYEYQFRKALAIENGGTKTSNLKKFTHILPGSPFVEKILQDGYALPDTQILSGYALPFAWEVCQKDCRERRKEKIGFYYPQIKEKKVISILTSGTEEKNKVFFENTNLTEFLNKINGEYFLLTNDVSLLEKTKGLPVAYKDSFGYINRVLKVRDLLSVTDVLFTNSGYLASSFAGCSNPVRCLISAGLPFESYMKCHYPTLCVPDGDELLSKIEGVMQEEAENKRFCEAFYYSDAKCFSKKARELFGLTNGS